MITIYLAGYGAEFSYREKCIKTWGDKFKFIDPMEESENLFKKHGFDFTVKDVFDKDIAFSHALRHDIVKQDKEFIDKSDILIAYIERKSFGTIMEIMYAYERDIPVHVINPAMNFSDDVWLSVHATMIWPALEGCFKYLINEDKKRND